MYGHSERGGGAVGAKGAVINKCNASDQAAKTTCGFFEIHFPFLHSVLRSLDILTVLV